MDEIKKQEQEMKKDWEQIEKSKKQADILQFVDKTIDVLGKYLKLNKDQESLKKQLDRWKKIKTINRQHWNVEQKIPLILTNEEVAKKIEPIQTSLREEVNKLPKFQDEKSTYAKIVKIIKDSMELLVSRYKNASKNRERLDEIKAHENKCKENVKLMQRRNPVGDEKIDHWWQIREEIMVWLEEAHKIIRKCSDIFGYTYALTSNEEYATAGETIEDMLDSITKAKSFTKANYDKFQPYREMDSTDTGTVETLTMAENHLKNIKYTKFAEKLQLKMDIEDIEKKNKSISDAVKQVMNDWTIVRESFKKSVEWQQTVVAKFKKQKATEEKKKREEEKQKKREENERLKREEEEQQERERKEREEQERKARKKWEREENERLKQQAEAEKKKEQEEKERLKKQREKNERLRQQAEAEKKKKQQENERQEKLKKQREEKEKRDREKKEREEKEKRDREKKEREKKEKRDKAKKEREEKERLEREEKERLEREEKERLRQLAEKEHQSNLDKATQSITEQKEQFWEKPKSKSPEIIQPQSHELSNIVPQKSSSNVNKIVASISFGVSIFLSIAFTIFRKQKPKPLSVILLTIAAISSYFVHKAATVLCVTMIVIHIAFRKKSSQLIINAIDAIIGLICSLIIFFMG